MRRRRAGAAERSTPSRLDPRCPVATATGAVRAGRGGVMALRDVLDALVDSEPFERLLLARSRPIVARAEAGQDFLLAGLSVAFGAPLLVVPPGPRGAGGPAGGD